MPLGESNRQALTAKATTKRHDATPSMLTVNRKSTGRGLGSHCLSLAESCSSLRMRSLSVEEGGGEPPSSLGGVSGPDSPSPCKEMFTWEKPHPICRAHRVIILNRGSMFAFQWREFSTPLSSAPQTPPIYKREIGEATIPWERKIHTSSSAPPPPPN